MAVLEKDPSYCSVNDSTPRLYLSFLSSVIIFDLSPFTSLQPTAGRYLSPLHTLFDPPHSSNNPQLRLNSGAGARGLQKIPMMAIPTRFVPFAALNTPLLGQIIILPMIIGQGGQAGMFPPHSIRISPAGSPTGLEPALPGPSFSAEIALVGSSSATETMKPTMDLRRDSRLFRWSRPRRLLCGNDYGLT